MKAHKQQLFASLLVSVCAILLECTCQFAPETYTFDVKEERYSRLCSTKSILTVNGQYPGPAIYARKGDTVFFNIINNSKYNITLHWHGVKQPRNPWSDGPEYITQCPIKAGGNFTQTIILSDEEGTLWWHAHSDWARATVHGAFIIYPKLGTNYPFQNPSLEVPIILGEWWKSDVVEVYNEFIATGGEPNISDAFTINGQPGDLYQCSTSETFNLNVQHGATVLLRIVNAAINTILFFGISNHPLTVIGIDASYTKPLTSNFILIAPGQTIDALLVANQSAGCYYMAARPYSSAFNATFNNSTTTAILQYDTASASPFSPSSLPYLPNYNDTNASHTFITTLRSLVTTDHPIQVPQKATHKIFSTISVNTLPCPRNRTCQGPNGTQFAASLSNMSFVLPGIDVLKAYYYHLKGVYSKSFPRFPPLVFNYTAEYQDLVLEVPNLATKVRALKYNSTVEITFQGTNLVAGIDHPIHLHGYSFYVVGFGLGNFNKRMDPRNYNLIDPPRQNTVIVPKNGWTTIRFKAQNPGVWYMHCHIDRHQTWGMMTTFIVKDGKDPSSRVLPPPPDMPPC